MFKENTVFILGAGASWHYGYPTGEKLVKKVEDKARKIAAYCNRHDLELETQGSTSIRIPDALVDKFYPEYRGEHWRAIKLFSKDFVGLADKIRDVHPLVIDYFLGQQDKKTQELGKLAIAWVLLECEHNYRVGGLLNTENRPRVEYQKAAEEGREIRDNWCRFILHEIVMGCNDIKKLLQNKVKFVTFNYDVSLETALYKALSCIPAFGENGAKEFLEDRIYHVYGEVRNYATEVNSLEESNKWRQQNVYDCNMLNCALRCGEGVETIALESGKTVNIPNAITAIANARNVYILGYGFDENNNRLLELPQHLDDSCRKRVIFTNYGNSNRVNKRASMLFFKRHDRFLSPEDSIQGDPKVADYYYEKSTRNVYDALEQDLSFYN